MDKNWTGVGQGQRVHINSADKYRRPRRWLYKVTLARLNNRVMSSPIYYFYYPINVFTKFHKAEIN